MNEIVKNELYYIVSMITEQQTANIEFDEKKQRYYVNCKITLTFSKEQFEALKLAKQEFLF